VYLCAVRLSSVLAGIAVLVCVVLAGQAPATADPPLPVYDGLLTFPTIKSSADPEQFSWRVELWPGQELRPIDEATAGVYYEDGTVAMVISAELAHDANGAAVPTDISVSEGEVVTLTVHHRAGNPAAAGASFTYPVSVGAGWEGGFSTVIVTGPKDEAELREERKARQAREEREALEAAERAEREPVPICVVPKLKGGSVNASRLKLRAAGCDLGEIRGTHSKTAKVVRQYPVPGTARAVGAEVAVKLGD
jgi:hypothetical protein